MNLKDCGRTYFEVKHGYVPLSWLSSHSSMTAAGNDKRVKPAAVIIVYKLLMMSDIARNMLSSQGTME